MQQEPQTQIRASAAGSERVRAAFRTISGLRGGGGTAQRDAACVRACVLSTWGGGRVRALCQVALRETQGSEGVIHV